MRLAALSLLFLPLILPLPTAIAQPELVLKAACIGGYANTVTEVAATDDGTISRQHYFSSGGKGKGWQVLGRDPDRVDRWLKSVDATEMSRVRVPTTVDRDPCNIGGSPACHIIRRKDNVDFYACRSGAVLKEMMDFNEWTGGPRATEAFQVMEQWKSAFAASDIDAIMKLFATDASLMGDNSKTVVSGQAQIRKYFEAAFATHRTRVLGATQSNTVLSEEVVLVTQYSAWTNAPEGYSFPDRITFVLAKREAGWLIIHFHSSATPN